MKPSIGCTYRVSVKAFILAKNNKILLLKEPDGVWDLPGGGLHYGEDPIDGLKREVLEETGLKTKSVSIEPIHFLTWKDGDKWKVNVVYLVELESFDFIPSDECVEIGFFSPNESRKLNLSPNVVKFLSSYLLLDFAHEDIRRSIE